MFNYLEWSRLAQGVPGWCLINSLQWRPCGQCTAPFPSLENPLSAPEMISWAEHYSTLTSPHQDQVPRGGLARLLHEAHCFDVAHARKKKLYGAKGAFTCARANRLIAKACIENRSQAGTTHSRGHCEHNHDQEVSLANIAHMCNDQ
jgi:hypothetical protein